MAVIGPRDVTVSRSDLLGWITEWKGINPLPDKRTFVQAKLDAMNVGDTLVDMVDLGQIPLTDLVLDEMNVILSEPPSTAVIV